MRVASYSSAYGLARPQDQIAHDHPGERAERHAVAGVPGGDEHTLRDRVPADERQAVDRLDDLARTTGIPS